MIRLLIQNWWLLLMRGIFAIAFAIFIYASPALYAGTAVCDNSLPPE